MSWLLRPLAEQAAALRTGQVTSTALVEEALGRIAQLDGALGAFLRVTVDLARRQAAEADRRLAVEGEGAPDLCGIPVAIKDVLCTEGVETTAASRILAGFVPPYTATAVRRLAEAGAVSLGKCNCDEFAMGSSTENSAYQLTRNPHAPDRVPGGSSGGSAAAVAAGLAPAALGTDTGGSIRQPAALCGVVGFKPTYGRVSRYGLIAFASSLDQVGPFTRTGGDAARIYRTIAGPDPRDATCSPRPVEDPMPTLELGLEGLRLGVPAEYVASGLEPGVQRVFEAACQRLVAAGAQLEPVSLPSTRYALAAYYVIAPAEASSNLARMDGLRFGPGRPGAVTLREQLEGARHLGFGPEVRRRIMLGTYALSRGYYDAYYRRAQQVRTLVAQDFHRAFAGVDAIIAPTSPTVAFRLGERLSDPLAMYQSDVLTVPFSLAGVPAASVPAGLADGLPVGLQVAAPAFADAHCLRVARGVERALGVAEPPDLARRAAP